jgi:hypothetical protein
MWCTVFVFCLFVAYVESVMLALMVCYFHLRGQEVSEAVIKKALLAVKMKAIFSAETSDFLLSTYISLKPRMLYSSWLPQISHVKFLVL